ncbi:MAG: flagellar FlbD family protein [Ruminococcus flavefaciens]|nr:flagellar FlbD family protein [Ruminococcus flavefaciens]
MPMIKLTDKDGIEFSLNINAIDGVVGINQSDKAKSVLLITDGSRIDVKETAVEVMQKIVNARFGL